MLGLICFGHVDWCDFVKPSITTIKQPAYEEGYKAAEIIIDILNDIPINSKQITLPSICLERESTNLKKK